jgi:hypothetical protein
LHNAVDAALEQGVKLDLDDFQAVCMNWTAQLIANVKRAMALLESGGEIPENCLIS